MGEPHAGRTALEAVDRPGVLDDLDAGRGHGGADGFGDLMVLGYQDAGCDLDQVDVRAERVEDRSYLHAGRASADHEQRWRHRGKVPRVAVRRGQVEAGNGQRPRGSASADDDLVCSKPQRVVAFDRVGIDESNGAGLLMDVHPGTL